MGNNHSIAPDTIFLDYEFRKLSENLSKIDTGNVKFYVVENEKLLHARNITTEWHHIIMIDNLNEMKKLSTDFIPDSFIST